MRWSFLSGGFLVAAAVCGCQAGAPLFNGRDLAGWEEIGSRGAWTARDGVLACDGRKDGYAWLCTGRRYGDFEFVCEWRLEADGNSGVFLRVPDRRGRASMTGLEVQIRDDRADADLTDASGAVFRRIPASGRYARPRGQWNHLRLVLVGRRLRIELNRHRVSDTDIDVVKPQGKDPPMSAIPNEGYIGLQNHGTPVEFRHIRIRDLSA